jgi:hypothetical protein
MAGLAELALVDEQMRRCDIQPRILNPQIDRLSDAHAGTSQESKQRRKGEWAQGSASAHLSDSIDQAESVLLGK